MGQLFVESTNYQKYHCPSLSWF